MSADAYGLDAASQKLLAKQEAKSKKNKKSPDFVLITTSGSNCWWLCWIVIYLDVCLWQSALIMDVSFLFSAG
eukprot:Em0008g106a